MEGFADEAENRLDQDLLLLASGNRTRDLQRLLKKYKDFIDHPDATNTDFAQKYKERILVWAVRNGLRGAYADARFGHVSAPGTSPLTVRWCLCGHLL